MLEIHTEICQLSMKKVTRPKKQRKMTDIVVVGFAEALHGPATQNRPPP